MPGPTQALSPNGENNNDIGPDGTNIIPYRKNTVRGERAYRYNSVHYGLKIYALWGKTRVVVA